ncbi:hypothetical protein VTP01DRAFT_8319 [Rhizomucor pusillus]|uniref:uncharacterized protein n=1 Tax=Rhizomucor pusillus TaxID=4840 RepID=UPI00374289AB
MGKAASLINMAGLSHEPLVLSIVHLASCEQLGTVTMPIPVLCPFCNVRQIDPARNKRRKCKSCVESDSREKKKKKESLTHSNLENSLSPALNQPVKAPCQASIPNKLSLQLG